MVSRKTEGPSMRLTFLGIEMDTLFMTLSLPPSKIDVPSERDSPLGEYEVLLQEGAFVRHWPAPACLLVIWPGRSFLRHIIELSRCVRELHHRVRLLPV